MTSRAARIFLDKAQSDWERVPYIGKQIMYSCNYVKPKDHYVIEDYLQFTLSDSSAGFPSQEPQTVLGPNKQYTAICNVDVVRGS